MLYVSLGAAIFNPRVAAAACGIGSRVRHLVDQRRPDRVAEIELQSPPTEAFADQRLPANVRVRLGLSSQLEAAARRFRRHRAARSPMC
jgi:hypothetical protein